MSHEPAFKTAICTDYERLLVACLNALEVWRSRREELCAANSIPKQAADELLRLQADYAKAFSRVERHEYDCELCQFVSKIGGRDLSAISDLALDKKRVN
jgi:hypothetical protein